MLKRAVLIAALIALPMRASAFETDNLLALAMMPLAVAAASEVTNVPVSDLVDVVTLLNQANVPPAQFVEIVRYTPVLLVEDVTPSFDTVLRQQIANGIEGSALFPVIERQFVAYDLPPVDLDTIPTVVPVVRETFIPDVVTTRVAEMRTRTHPHGGPPGQLKKQIGVQTGAEVVHGTFPGRGHGRTRTTEHVTVAKPHHVTHETRVVKVHPSKPAHVKVEHAKPNHVMMPAPPMGGPPAMHGNPHAGGGGDHGGGGGGGKGHGKGKG